MTDMDRGPLPIPSYADALDDFAPRRPTGAAPAAKRAVEAVSGFPRREASADLLRDARNSDGPVRQDREH